MRGEGAVKGAFRAANSMDNRRLAAAAAAAAAPPFTIRSGESSAKWGKELKWNIGGTAPSASLPSISYK